MHFCEFSSDYLVCHEFLNYPSTKRTPKETGMSLFKKPKKAVQQSRRIFSSELDFMDVDEDEKAEDEVKLKKKDKKDKDKDREKVVKPTKPSLLSFGDEGLFLA